MTSRQITPDQWLELRSIRFTHGEINSVVEDFYRQVATDPQLSVPFSSVKDWPHHIERLTHFWWTRFGGAAYLEASYDPIGKHFETGFTRELLERWLTLFQSTVTALLRPEQAEIWVELTKNMGQALARHNDLMILRHAEKSKGGCCGVCN